MSPSIVIVYLFPSLLKTSSYCKSIFIPSPRVLLVLTEKEVFKSPISKSETQCKLLAVSLCTVKKTSDISKRQRHRVYVCTTKGKQGVAKKNRTEILLKIPRVSNKPCKAIGNFQNKRWCHMSLRGGVGSPAPITLAVAAHLSTVVAWLCSLPVAFLSRYSMFQICNFLRSPLRLWLYSYNFLHFRLKSCPQEPDSATHCLAVETLF